MFDVGFAELFLLGLIGLLVLGPERLPAVARTLGGMMRKARASWASLRSTIEAELAEADIAKPMKQARDEFNQMGKDLKPNLPDVNSILKPDSRSSKKPSDDISAEPEPHPKSEKEEEAEANHSHSSESKKDQQTSPNH